MGWQMFVDAPVRVKTFRGSNFGLAYVDSTFLLIILWNARNF